MAEACQNFVEVLKIYMDFAKILRVQDSACSKVVSYVKIFQFHNMLKESERYRATANGLQYL
jgi:hypothetical protein